MFLPPQIAEVTVDQAWRYETPYPPLGFRPLAEGALGNGDTFGLYWPIGLEAREPIVVETWHDSWQIQPVYSSLSSFLVALAKAEDAYPEPPSLMEDPRSPRALLEDAKRKVQAQAVAEAVQLLERALDVLPEYTDALCLLWAQHVRQGRIDEALAVAIRAIIAPPSLGGRATRPLRWLQAQGEAPALEHDPIWQARAELKLSYGGAKENGDYAIYRSAIQAYLGASRYVEASMLMQTYAELMQAETVAFQERHGFVKAEFLAAQIAASARLPDGPRA
jgi:tetratricopeptide (TPR) repeat protein